MGEEFDVSCECWRTPRSAADFVFSQTHLLARRRRHVLRRLRPLCRHQCAALASAVRLFDAAAGRRFHLEDLYRHDHRGARHRLSRRQIWPALHLPGEPAHLRTRFAGGGRRTRHDPAQLGAFRHGPGARRRDRRRLFDTHGIRAAEVARALAIVHGLSRRLRPAGHRTDRVFRHSQFRLASDVRHRRYRRADRLVSAQELAGIAALAGIERPHRGSGSVDERNRKRSRDRGPATAPPPRLP